MTIRLFHTSDQADLSYVDCGAAGDHAVVLLHSLGADHRMWSDQRDALAPKYRVLMPDTRGHGRSTAGTTTSVSRWAGDLHEMLVHAEVARAVLVGVSLGGIQAMAYAAAHPDRAAGIVVADSFAALPADTAKTKISVLSEQARTRPMREVAERYVADTFQEAPPAGAEWIRSAMASLSPDAYLSAVAACFSADIVDLLPAIECPALVLWGDRDHKTPRSLSEEIVAALPHAELRQIPDAGHLSNIDNPAAFNDLLLAFLENRVTAFRPSTGVAAHG